MGIFSAHDLGLSDLIEVVLLVCLGDLLKGRKEGGEGGSGGLKQHVIGPQLSKDSATGFTISSIHEFISPFCILNP